MTVKILVGDCRARLCFLANASAHMCATSPPYFGLRDYNIEPQIWGGDIACVHEWVDDTVMRKGSTNGRETSTLASAGSPKTLGAGSNSSIGKTKQYRADAGAFCAKCGAWHGNLGLEPTPKMYVDHLVEVFRVVRRVLRDDGVVWLNLGDTYASDWVCNRRSVVGAGSLENGKRADRPSRIVDGLKEKDLIGIPWRVAFALQEDGWFLRQDVIWQKPNPLPESVKDRCTKSHEYVFLLSKAERYYYDHIAVMEDAVSCTIDHDGEAKARGSGNIERKPASARGVPVSDDGSTNGAVAGSVPWLGSLKRNKRSVWMVATEPYRGAHFAVFPPALVEPCVKAGTSEVGCCAICGRSWTRVTWGVTEMFSFSGVLGTEIKGKQWVKHNPTYEKQINDNQDVREGPISRIETVGWYPACKCGKVAPLPPYPKRPQDRKDEAAQAAWIEACGPVTKVRAEMCAEATRSLGRKPCLVLDPFGGAGTTALVADRLQRDAVICEINLDYAVLAENRIISEGGMLSKVEVVAP